MSTTTTSSSTNINKISQSFVCGQAYRPRDYQTTNFAVTVQHIPNCLNCLKPLTSAGQALFAAPLPDPVWPIPEFRQGKVYFTTAGCSGQCAVESVKTHVRDRERKLSWLRQFAQTHDLPFPGRTLPRRVLKCFGGPLTHDQYHDPRLTLSVITPSMAVGPIVPVTEAELGTLLLQQWLPEKAHASFAQPPVPQRTTSETQNASTKATRTGKTSKRRNRTTTKTPQSFQARPANSMPVSGTIRIRRLMRKKKPTRLF